MLRVGMQTHCWQEVRCKQRIGVLVRHQVWTPGNVVCMARRGSDVARSLIVYMCFA